MYDRLVGVVTDLNVIYRHRAKKVRIGNKNGLCPTLMSGMGEGGNNKPI